MTTIYFVRHAQPNYNNPDDFNRELTEKGLADRIKIKKYLMDKNIEIAISSPYVRCVDTIKPFCDSAGLKIEMVFDLRERGIGTERWLDDFDGFAEKQWADFDYRLNDEGECLNQVQSRNIAALSDILKRYADKTIVIGTHGTALSTIINHYDSSWGYEKFMEIKKITPFITKMCFEKDKFIGYEIVNVL